MITPGARLAGKYRLEEHIIRGGVGQVWRAFDTNLHRTVAVKILKPELLGDPQFVEIFRAEGLALAKVDHRGVVRVLDHGNDRFLGPYLVMEYVNGDVLSKILRAAPLPPEWTMDLVAQAGDALHAVHERGIVHRNVTPGTLMVRRDGSLVLIGFRNAGSADLSEQAHAGPTRSPEEVKGAPQTRLTDVHALGVVAYQCLTGLQPLDSSNGTAHYKIPPLSSGIPDGIRRVVEKAIAENPEERWSTAAELAEAARAAITRADREDEFEVIICYRRADTGGWAGRIFDHLETAFGRAKVFLDAESIAGGVDFGKATIEAVGKSRIVLAVIGTGWLDAETAGVRRLGNPKDLVRREIETALEAKKRIVPVLVDGASMPVKGQLPRNLQPLAERAGVEVSLVRFRNDVRALIDSLRT
jgi:hypothetical protein